MSSYRLKNIIICILLFVNVALFLLAANNLYRQNQQQQNLEEQVLELYADSGITLSVNQIAAPHRMYSLSLLRDSEEEMLFTACPPMNGAWRLFESEIQSIIEETTCAEIQKLPGER